MGARLNTMLRKVLGTKKKTLKEEHQNDYRETTDSFEFVKEFVTQEQYELLLSIWQSDISFDKRIACLDLLTNGLSTEARGKYEMWKNTLPVCSTSSDDNSAVTDEYRLNPLHGKYELYRMVVKRRAPKGNEIPFTLVYKDDKTNQYDTRICYFNPGNCQVDYIARFSRNPWVYETVATPDKIYSIRWDNGPFEIFDMKTCSFTRGPNPPSFRCKAALAYFKEKLYYIGGVDTETNRETAEVDVLENGIWHRGLDLPHPTRMASYTICDGKMYVVANMTIYRLSDDESQWIRVFDAPYIRGHIATVSSKIYSISYLFSHSECFDSNLSDNNQSQRIPNLKYRRYDASLVTANEKLYVIGGFCMHRYDGFSKPIEEYDPKTDMWRIVGYLK